MVYSVTLYSSDNSFTLYVRELLSRLHASVGLVVAVDFD